MSGCSSTASTATLSPCTTLKTPSGRPASFSSSAVQTRRGRILLRRLQHERVAARDRGRPHPHGHHRREVERRDARDDAERLPDRVHVDAGRRLLRELALQTASEGRSRTRSPRARASPRPSRPTAPCRAPDVRIRAISSRRSCTSSRMRKKSSARFASETSRHAANAAFAACTAASTSSDRREVDLARSGGPVAGL